VKTDIVLTLGQHEFTLRPTFERMNAIEEELGSAFSIVDRATQGQVTVNDVVTVLWHCIQQWHVRSEAFVKYKDAFGELIMEHGVATATPAFRALLTAVLAGPNAGEAPQ